MKLDHIDVLNCHKLKPPRFRFYFTIWKKKNNSRHGLKKLYLFKTILASYIYKKNLSSPNSGKCAAGAIQWLRGHNFDRLCPPTCLYVDIFNPEHGKNRTCLTTPSCPRSHRTFPITFDPTKYWCIIFKRNQFVCIFLF